MRAVTATMVTMGLLVAGCGSKTATLPTDPLELAATCGVITAAGEREATGLKGDLSADAQGRILHYAMLYASEGGSFDNDKVNAVSRRMPALSESAIKGKWQTLRPGCASAFPATQIGQPALPDKPLDAMLECYVTADFLRKALSAEGPSYGDAATRYGVLTGKLDTKMSPALRAAGIRNGDALTAKKAEALAAATKRGQPPALVSACQKKYNS